MNQSIKLTDKLIEDLERPLDKYKNRERRWEIFRTAKRKILQITKAKVQPDNYHRYFLHHIWSNRLISCNMTYILLIHLPLKQFPLLF